MKIKDRPHRELTTFEADGKSIKWLRVVAQQQSIIEGTPVSLGELVRRAIAAQYPLPASAPAIKKEVRT